MLVFGLQGSKRLQGIDEGEVEMMVMLGGKQNSFAVRPPC